MGAYLDKRLNSYRVTFSYNNKTYTKRFPKFIEKEEAEAYENGWRKKLVDEEFKEIGALVRKDADALKWVARFNQLAQERKTKTKEGKVYVIRFMDYYKIGFTTNIDRRIGDFTKVSLPVAPELILTISTTHPKLMEDTLHEKFKDQRANGEWFSLDESDVHFLKELAEKYLHYKG